MSDPANQTNVTNQIDLLVAYCKKQTNQSIAHLLESSIRNEEGLLSNHGTLSVKTGKYTGRSPNDRYISDQNEYHDLIDWGSINRPIPVQTTMDILNRMVDYLHGKTCFIQELSAGASPQYQHPVMVVTEYAWHSIFARHLFRPKLVGLSGKINLICAPGFQADPEIECTNSQTFIILDFKLGLILIGGTSYAGEIKKAVFTYLNFLYPQNDVLPMHCAANIDSSGKSALFFGLSGTGKTTLSSDPERILIGDDEHGWSENGIFNFEGGCYAKTIRLDRSCEPLIWNAVNQFGAVLENAVMDKSTRQIDFANDSLTENTRAAYPISFIKNSSLSGLAGHPEHIFFLTADAHGVLPPISRLTHSQIIDFYLLGYTSKIAGTERGLSADPKMTFSFGFGAPFFPQKPDIYIQLLLNRINKYKTSVWLVNTGWIGGNFGTGQRIPLPMSRQLVNSVLKNELNEVEFIQEPYFGLFIPKNVNKVTQSILNPTSLWNDLKDYERTAIRLRAQIDHQLQLYNNVNRYLKSESI